MNKETVKYGYYWFSDTRINKEKTKITILDLKYETKNQKRTRKEKV